MAEATIALLGDGRRRRALGRQSRDRVISLFTLSRCIANYRELYGELVGADLSSAAASDPAALVDEAPAPPAHPGDAVEATGERVVAAMAGPWS